MGIPRFTLERFQCGLRVRHVLEYVKLFADRGLVLLQDQPRLAPVPPG